MSNETEENKTEAPRPITLYTPADTEIGDPLWDPAMFDHMWRVARMFAASNLVPEHLRGKPEDCFLALSMAKRSGQEPLSVLQSIHFVKGKAGWNATYLIARAKLAGMPLDWDIEKLADKLTADRYQANQKTIDKKNQPIENLAVTCFATVNGQRKETTITTSDAILEGWTANPKYFSMLEQMLCYRTATRLVRRYMPEILLGLPPAEELEVLQVVEQPSPAGAAKAALEDAKRHLPPPKDDPEPEPEEDDPGSDDDGDGQMSMTGMPS